MARPTMGVKAAARPVVWMAAISVTASCWLWPAWRSWSAAARGPPRRPVPPASPTPSAPAISRQDRRERMLGDGNRWREIRKYDGRGLTDEDATELSPGQVLYLPPGTSD